MNNPKHWLTEADLAQMEKTGQFGGYDAGNVWEFRALIAMARFALEQRKASGGGIDQ